ncbi:transporter [Archangium violaceum]|uniref:transporter n=1 Tax=Archangium violaceum TaxID=83451 RepID=UPI001950FDEB|nr:transporter [Archangium violaceum]QRO02090.1 transporter [Archangium violaceum]
MWKSLSLIPLLVASLLVPTAGLACATCSCGDPTLTSMGTEQPFAGRLRLATQLRAWSQTTGQEAIDAVSLRELRMDVSVAYAPAPWLFLSATLPLQARTVQDVSLARETAWGLGDMEVGAKVFVFRDRDFSPDNLFGILVGTRLPTSPTQRDATGRPLSLDAQLGTGSVDPFLGLAWSGFRADWSFLASATGYLPTRGREGFRAGAALRTTLATQFQPSPRWALRLAVDGRLEGPSDTFGVKDPVGSGFIAFLSPDLLLSPTTDVVVQLGVRVPVLNRLRNVHQTPILQASIAYDL